MRVESGEIVVRDGSKSWQPESGQIVIDFEEGAQRQEGSVLLAPSSAQDWYERACELEETSPTQARQAYRHALKLDSHHLDSHLNLGRLLHEVHDLKEAQSHYRAALEINPGDATAAFNLGVVLQDLGLIQPALEAYERAIEAEPGQIDAYHNAVHLYEKLGDKAAAVRLLKRLRRLRQ